MQHDQPPPRQSITQRNEPDDAEAVADERRRRHPESGALAELGDDQPEQRLIVVDIGHGSACDERQAEPGLAVEGTCTGDEADRAPSRGRGWTGSERIGADSPPRQPGAPHGRAPPDAPAIRPVAPHMHRMRAASPRLTGPRTAHAAAGSDQPSFYDRGADPFPRKPQEGLQQGVRDAELPGRFRQGDLRVPFTVGSVEISRARDPERARRAAELRFARQHGVGDWRERADLAMLASRV